MRIGKCFLLITFFSISVSSQAQLLYSITSKNVKDTSYIFGTMQHPVKNYDLPVAILNLSIHIDAVFFESVTKDRYSPDFFELKKTIFYYTDGDHLKKHITDEDFEILKNKFLATPARFDARGYDTLLPVHKPYALNLLYVDLMTEANNSHDIDTKIENRAKAVSKPVYAVEDYTKLLNDQLKYSNRVTPAFLVSKIDSFYQRHLAVAKAYHEQDIKTLNQLFGKDTIAIRRNKEWMNRLTKEFSSRSCLAVVNVAQMTGEEGLLRMLKRKGYTVTAIPLQLKEAQVIDMRGMQ